MCHGTFGRLARSPATYFCFARVCILTKRFFISYDTIFYWNKKALKCETLLFSHLRAYNFYFIISFMILIIVNIFSMHPLSMTFSSLFYYGSIYPTYPSSGGFRIWKLFGIAVLFTFSLLSSRLYGRFWNCTKSCAMRSRTLPPVGNYTLPWRYRYFVVIYYLYCIIDPENPFVNPLFLSFIDW